MSANSVEDLMIPSKKGRASLSPNDRISKLPDGIISHILSRLRTEDAMKTSVLSRSWKNRWTSIYEIDIVDGSKYDVLGFMNFVTMILLRTCNSRIRSFTISCEQMYEHRFLETWISNLLMRNLEILNIYAPKLIGRHSWYFGNWTSLTELVLHANCTLVLPIDNVFPNLKRLVLRESDCGGMKIKHDQISSEGRIILLFPVLEFMIMECEWLDVNSVEIHASELISFVNFCPDEFKNYEIKIFGAKLARFESIRGSINNFDLHGSPAVSSAILDHRRDKDDQLQDITCLLPRAHEILKQLQVLECLTLNSELVELLVPSNSGLVFPTFGRLRKLHLLGWINIKDLVELLQLMPPVEHLNINVEEWDIHHQETGQHWPPKIDVSNLVKVKLRNFNGHKLQLEFLMFVVENAKNLKKLSVVVGDEAPVIVTATMNVISNLLRSISSCVIEVF